MMHIIKDHWQHHRLLLLGFVTTLAVTLFFLTRLITAALYWSNPAHQDVAISGWMTPRYVARSYQIDPDLLFDAIDFDHVPGQPLTLNQIATASGRRLPELIAALQSAISAARADSATGSAP